MNQFAKVLLTLTTSLMLSLTGQAQSEYEHAFLWTQAGGMQDLGTISGLQNSIAYAVSNNDEVVGYDAATGVVAFRWTDRTGMKPVPGASPIYSVAVAVNDSGEVAGVFNATATISHAF